MRKSSAITAQNLRLDLGSLNSWKINKHFNCRLRNNSFSLSFNMGIRKSSQTIANIGISYLLSILISRWALLSCGGPFYEWPLRAMIWNSSKTVPSGVVSIGVIEINLFETEPFVTLLNLWSLSEYQTNIMPKNVNTQVGYLSHMNYIDHCLIGI